MTTQTDVVGAEHRDAGQVHSARAPRGWTKATNRTDVIAFTDDLRFICKKYHREWVFGVASLILMLLLAALVAGEIDRLC